MSLVIELLPRYGRALVVGGGAVATRKAQSLVEGGFSVTVVAPAVATDIAHLRGVRVIERAFEPADLRGHRLVFACTDSREVNEAVGEAARAAGMLVVVADSQDESTFFTPALHRDGDLSVAVGTGGASPTLARKILDRLVVALGSGWAQRVDETRRERRERIASRGGAAEPDE